MYFYTLSGLRVLANAQGEILSSDAVTITLGLAQGTQTLSYSNVLGSDTALLRSDLSTPIESIAVNGTATMPAGPLLTLIGALFPPGGTTETTFLGIGYTRDTGQVVELTAYLDGAPLPTPEALIAGTGLATRAATAPFAPDTPFDLGALPDVSLRAVGTDAADALRGTSGADDLTGAGGNDTLSGGDGADTLNAGAGDDVILGGASAADLRDVIFAGTGHDAVDAGHGNDQVYGGAGDDTIAGGFGVDELIGQDGNDVITGSAFSDLVFGGAGDDFVNGGFGSDRVNGGAGADRFYHLGIEGHGSDWLQDYSGTEGDVLLYGGTASRADFQINTANTMNAGDAGVDEAFVIYRPTGQILWALVDGADAAQIILRVNGAEFDLLG